MTTPTPQPDPKSNPPSAEPQRAISSTDLLKGNREVKIQHSGEVYRLLLTRNGKLILQK